MRIISFWTLKKQHKMKLLPSSTASLSNKESLGQMIQRFRRQIYFVTALVMAISSITFVPEFVKISMVWFPGHSKTLIGSITNICITVSMMFSLGAGILSILYLISDEKDRRAVSSAAVVSLIALASILMVSSGVQYDWTKLAISGGAILLSAVIRDLLSEESLLAEAQEIAQRAMFAR